MKGMLGTPRFSAFAFTALLIASILFSMFSAVPILIRPVSATPDPVTNTHYWYSQPIAHTTTTITVTNPSFARDKNNVTAARFNYGLSTPGSFDLRTFGTQLVRDPPLPVIKQVDIKMIYAADANPSQTYRIEYQVGASSFQTLVADTGEVHSNATATVWANRPEPNDGIWDWTDIGNVRLRVSVSGGPGGSPTYFWEAEGWLTIIMEDSPKMFIDPANITDTGKVIGTTFTINVRIQNISDASGVQFSLGYDPAVLQSNPQWVMGNLFVIPPFLFTNQTDNVKGKIIVAYTHAALTQTAFGSAVLATFTFSVIGRGETTLNLYTTSASDSRAADILFEVEDGYFRNVAMPYGATIKVIVPTQELSQGFTAPVNITRSVGESGAFGVYVFEFNMTYDKVRLNATSVALGSFMGPSSTVTFQRIINYAEGWVWVNVTRKKDQVAGFKPPGAWGNGTLVTISFDILNSGVATMSFSEASLTRFDYGLGDMDSESNPAPSKNPFSDLPANAVGGQVTISKIPPRARFSYSPSEPLPGDVITFNASASSDVDGFIVSWSWDFGDGNSDSGEVVTHSYALPADYSVRLTVTDNDTLTGTQLTILKVFGHDVAVPSISVSPDRTIVPGEIVTVLVVVMNQGDFNETADVNVYFNVTAGANPNFVQAAPTQHVVDLTPSATVPLTFLWNTTGLGRGMYVVKANVTVVPGELDLLDNEATVNVKLSPMVAPVASFVFSPSAPLVDESVAFDASGSTDPDGGVINRLDWAFGDGSTARYFGGNLSRTTAHVYTVAGVYNVTLTVRDDDNLVGRFSRLVTVMGESSITIAAAPGTAAFGGAVIVSGAITPTRAGVTVSIYWRVQGSSSWTLLITRTTDSGSAYSYSWMPSQVAVYQLKGNWTGDALTLGAESSVISVTVNKVASEVSVSLTDSALVVGDSVTISGQITPSRSGVSVILEYRDADGTTWNQLVTLTTNAGGQYSYLWSPDVAGDYVVRARWDGDANTTGDTSNEASVLVEEPSTGGGLSIPLYAIVAIVVVVVVAVAAVYFLRFRKR